MECVLLPIAMILPMGAMVAALVAYSLSKRGRERQSDPPWMATVRNVRRKDLEAQVRLDSEGWRFTLRPPGSLGAKLTLCQAGTPHFADLDLGPSAEVEVGDRSFDALYLIRSRPGSFATSVLTPDLVAEIRHFGRRGDIAAIAGPSIIGLRFLEMGPADEDQVQRFIDLGFRFAEAVLAAAPETAPAVAVETGALGVGGRCAVCGAPFRSAPLSCLRCAAPHHRDCWEFMGRCAIYGCGSREVSAARS